MSFYHQILCGNHTKARSHFSYTQNSLPFYKKVGSNFPLTVTSRHLISTVPRTLTADEKIITDPMPSII